MSHTFSSLPFSFFPPLLHLSTQHFHLFPLILLPPLSSLHGLSTQHIHQFPLIYYSPVPLTYYSPVPLTYYSPVPPHILLLPPSPSPPLSPILAPFMSTHIIFFHPSHRASCCTFPSARGTTPSLWLMWTLFSPKALWS